MNLRRTIGLAAVAGVVVAAALPALSQATPSSGTGKIAFSARVHGISQVFTVKPDGTHLRQVTFGQSQAGQYGLAWSPDGRGLLFTVTDAKGIDRILKSGADGSGVTTVSPACTGTCLGDDDPAYSPDGKKVAFERAFGPVVNDNASGGVTIYTMNADGSRLTQLTQAGANRASAEDHAPQWSPDGTKIAFVRSHTTGGPSNKSAIEVMNADGSNVRRLTPWKIEATDPRWSPDGKRILFNTWAEAFPGKSANLYTMNADGTHRVALTHFAGGTLQAFASGWSPDGTQILFRRMKFSGTDTEVGGYFVLDLPTRHVRRLAPVRLRYDSSAAWGK
jgi:Tol biopolymer transport system component